MELGKTLPLSDRTPENLLRCTNLREVNCEVPMFVLIAVE